MKTHEEQIRIGQLAQLLDVKNFVIRFWEKEFNLKPVRSDGGQRFYTSKEVEKFKLIKSLLYERGYTISGAKKALKDNYSGSVLATKTTIEPEVESNEYDTKEIFAQMHELHKQLLKLRELL